MFHQVLPWPCWSCLGQRGERVNEVPRKEAGCQLGSVTHWQLFPRVLSKEILEKPWVLLCQHGEIFLEERMCRDWGSKEEAEGRAELGVCFVRVCSVFPLLGGASRLHKILVWIKDIPTFGVRLLFQVPTDQERSCV